MAEPIQVVVDSSAADGSVSYDGTVELAEGATVLDAIEATGLDNLIKASYTLLGLISFLTDGKKECRAWTIRQGTRAPQAAGKIHTDIERGFIRAEVIAGARQARDEGAARAAEIEEIFPRATAIRTAVSMAGPRDSILVAGRCHETTQEIAGVDHPLDDRQELRDALHDTQEGRWGRS